jgi:predicted RNase H-like nuclease (RuvC/YqgF family)
MSDPIHKQALDSVKHVQEKYNELKRTMDRKDKLYEEGKTERDILKKQVAELQKEVEQLKSRRPGAKRGAKQRRTQDCGNEYAKTYITGISR